MEWNIIDTGKRSASENMRIDAELLELLEYRSQPIIHLYDWQSDAATFGHFIEPASFLNLEGVQKMGLEIAKRPTGGGIIFHLSDLAFSILIPATHPKFSHNPLENYAFINQKVIVAIQEWAGGTLQLLPNEPTSFAPACRQFCMAKPTKYDVMLGGRKVGGAAQRKTRFGYLHQGSIFLGNMNRDYLKTVLKFPEDVIQGMDLHSFPLLGQQVDFEDIEKARCQLSHHLCEIFVS